MEIPSEGALVRAGEVIQASTGSFIGQCYKLHQAPPLGSLVKFKGVPLEIYGVVCQVETHSLDPGRRPIARGTSEGIGKSVLESNPQLVKLLCTDFRALVVGYCQGDILRQYLPPSPPSIHGFIYLCPWEEVREFSRSLDFLGLMVSDKSTIASDEVIAACLRCFSQAYPEPQAFLLQAGRELASLLTGEFRRFQAILKKIKP